MNKRNNNNDNKGNNDSLKHSGYEQAERRKQNDYQERSVERTTSEKPPGEPPSED